MPCAPGACGWPSASTLPARKRSAASRPSIRSILRCRRGGRQRPTRFTRTFPTSPASRSRPTPRARPARQAMAAAPPTPPTCWPHALAPHGGVVLYRAFVYNNHLDYNDLKADRARAAYDIFHPLDGKFAPNVIVQIKYGPIDFQAREPVSPLFAGLEKTNSAMEVADHAGVHRAAAASRLSRAHVEADARLRSARGEQIDAGERDHRGQELQSAARRHGRRFLRGTRWLARLTAGHGESLRLRPPGVESQSFSRSKSPQEWTRQTISYDPQVVATVTKMLMQSWPAYEHYTGPLGTQTLTDITGSHYGPNIEASERNGWGQWHRDDAQGIGMDRTVATGTGFAGQYPPKVAKMYESLSHDAGQSASVLPSRAVHLQAAFGRDCDPVLLRQPLPGRGRSGASRPRMGDAEGQDRSAAL